MNKCDFMGWATRANLKCSDGRVIMKDAFKHNDGQKVPLVWNHQHNDPTNILGHALLENREEGVFAYCSFNDNEQAQAAKNAVLHKDISALSIHANQLKQDGNNVLHGCIREVSLVLAGANPGAYISSIISHGEESTEEAIIYSGESLMFHSDEEVEEVEETEQEIDSTEESEEETETEESEKVEETKTEESEEVEKAEEGSEETENLDLKKYVYIKMEICGKVFYEKLLADAFEEKTFTMHIDHKTPDDDDITVTYYLPENVGNEAQKAQSTFKLLVTAVSRTPIEGEEQ